MIYNIISVVPVNKEGYKEGTEVNKTQQVSVCLLKTRHKMRSMTGLKSQSMSNSLLKKGRMFGQLDHKKGTRMLGSGVGCVDCV